MLDISHIVKLYRNGLDLYVKKFHNLGFKGEFDPSQLAIFIYSFNLESDYDRDITILHEFIHARNDILYDRWDRDDNVEKEAICAYNKSQSILTFIKELYNLKDYFNRQTFHATDCQNPC